MWFEGAGVADSARRYLYADERGSIIAVTDGNGNKLAINTYDEYGIPGSGNTGRFQYTGQAWVPELGMYYYKARMYSPTLGRFMQTDPIGYEDQVNLYAYVANDPINGVDPTGMQSAMENWFDANAKAYLGGAIDETTYEERQGAAQTGGEIGSLAIPGGAALRLTGAFLSRAPRAFQIAARGGQHSGFLRNYAGRSLGEIRSGIRSIGRQIRAHEDKIRDPAKHVTNWDKRSPEYQRGVVEKWKKDIARQKEQRDVLRGLERTRKQCIGTRICR